MDTNKLSSLIETKLASIGYELSSLKTYFEKGNLVLAIVVDRVEPIGMKEICDVSEMLSNYLDEVDAFDSAYTLDVSSLGAEKPLKVEELANYASRYVNVHLVNPIDGENIYEGTLESVNETSLVLSVRIKTRVKKIDILLCNIYKVRLAIKF